MEGEILYLWSAKEFWVHNIWPKISCIPISSASVKLYALISCLQDILYMLPLPSVIVQPVCPCIFWLVVYEVSTHHSIESKLSTDIVSTTLIVTHMYLMSWTSFFQSSLSGWVTLVIWNPATTCISGCPLLLTNSSLDVIWLNSGFRSSSSFDCFLLT